MVLNKATETCIEYSSHINNYLDLNGWREMDSYFVSTAIRNSYWPLVYRFIGFFLGLFKGTAYIL